MSTLTTGRPGIRRRRGRDAGRLGLLVVLAVVMAFPLLWMLLTAVSPDRDLNSADLRFWPSVLRLDNFSRAWNSLPFSTWLVNSVAIALVAVVITVAINLVAGFVLAKMRFTGRSVLLLVIVSTLMIPVQVLMIPQFRIVAELGWVNTYWAVIIPRAAEAFGIFLSRQFMLAIPDELIDAARVDGAGTLRILRSVILPLCKPLIAVLVIFTFMYRWNEFAWPLIVLKDQGLYTLPIGLTFLQGQYTTDYSGLMAMALVSALPMLVVFLVFQRYLVEGISTTGLK
ncbi:carbohydrate ABC transporter permease [Motilibacter aurantiacus]|uniref:carbohydrate ABC transporter permease n=1 Tax=Motilibacter aurantiacus TaxID=2714955 RepID=UPI002F2B2CD6